MRDNTLCGAILAMVLCTLSLAGCSSARINEISRRFQFREHNGKHLPTHTFWFEIRDKDGHFVHHLPGTKDSVRVIQRGLDMGTEATKGFRKLNDGVLHVVLDVSQSMREAGAVETLIKSVTSLIRKAGAVIPNLRVVIYTFSTGTTTYRQLAEGGIGATDVWDEDSLFVPKEMVEADIVRLVVESQLAAADPSTQYTNLYGALSFVGRSSRRVRLEDVVHLPQMIVLFTDGKDNMGEATLAQVIAQKADMPHIIAVGLGDVDREALSTIAERGMFYYAERVEELEDAFDRLAQNIAFFWQFDFYPPIGREAEDVELVVEHPEYGEIAMRFEVGTPTACSRIEASYGCEVKARMACVSSGGSASTCNSSALGFAPVQECVLADPDNSIRVEACVYCALKTGKRESPALMRKTLGAGQYRRCVRKQMSASR